MSAKTFLITGAVLSGVFAPLLIYAGYRRNANEKKIKNDPNYQQTWLDKNIRSNLIHAIWIIGVVLFLVGLFLVVPLPVEGARGRSGRGLSSARPPKQTPNRPAARWLRPSNPVRVTGSVFLRHRALQAVHHPKAKDSEQTTIPVIIFFWGIPSFDVRFSRGLEEENDVGGSHGSHLRSRVEGLGRFLPAPPIPTLVATVYGVYRSWWTHG